MTSLLLCESEQDALRAVIASEPAPGMALPGECVLHNLARLIACDALGAALLDGRGSAVERSILPRARATDDDLLAIEGPFLGIHQLDRTPAGNGSSAARGVAVLCLGVRHGRDHVVQLWMVRRTTSFSKRERALLALAAPALERLMRAQSTSALTPCLTHQERRVLRRVATGLSNSEIAEQLFIAPCTVRKHLENAYRKLGVTNRLAAVVAMSGGRPMDLRTADVDEVLA
jgi:DNA-binding CsgD family transcriptional regulator